MSPEYKQREQAPSNCAEGKDQRVVESRVFFGVFPALRRSVVTDQCQHRDDDHADRGVFQCRSKFHEFVHSDFFQLWADRFPVVNLFLDFMFPFFLFLSGMLFGGLMVVSQL